jgi:hypothetical protein
MLLYWLIPIAVACITVAVAWKLLAVGVGGAAGRVIAIVAGIIILAEGCYLLISAGSFSTNADINTAVNGAVLIFTGAGIWAIAHRSRRWTEHDPGTE